MGKTKVVIIGAGFGGLSIAKNLAEKNVDVLILDKNNYHTFQPLLYQVATGGLEPDSIAYPIRRIFRGKKNIRFRMTQVDKINVEDSSLNTTIGEIKYDYLVIATGSTDNFFNFEHNKNKLLSLKTITNALDIRSYLMQNLETVLITANKSEQEEIVNIAIIGGGPAGIEMAGALAEMKKKVLPKDFPEFNFDIMHIYLFEVAENLLPNMSRESSEFSLKYLTDLGVEVKLKTRVLNYDGHKIYLGDKTEFQTDTVVWTAGVQGELIGGINKDVIVPGNRIIVNEFNQVLNSKNIFAIGDIAANIDDINPKGLPMLAQVAIQQGKHLAKNLLLLIQMKEMIPFKYKNKGIMATVGRNKAVVDLPKYKFQGRLAWFVWMFIHLIALVGFRNKLVTFIDWAQNYLNYDRPLGIIIRKYKREE
jgi:NADH dehydrogenase